MTTAECPLRLSSCRPLSRDKLALLPAALFDQTVAAPVECDGRWAILSAEPPDAPSPQTRRLQAAMVRLGHNPEILHGSRLRVQGYLKGYGGEVRDAAEETEPGDAAAAAHLTENAVSRLARDLVEHALDTQVTDIHLECRKHGGTRVRFRRSGRLLDGPFPLQNQHAEAVAHYLFSLGRSGNRQWQPSAPCDGAVELPVRPGAPNLHLRLSSMPEVRGWDLAIRLFTLTRADFSLQQAGYRDRQTEAIRRACHRPYGAVLFSGPTGSGKSTSMLAALAELPAWLKIVSLEQPVERTLPNISHVTVGLTEDMAAMAPAFNRCDADVAVLGELRDATGAAVLRDFVTAGKLALATVHAARAWSIPLRLRELGIDRSLICDPTFLVALINQRLLPRLCTHCRLPLADHRHRLPDWYRLAQTDGVFVRGDGCGNCAAGCSGKLLAAEVVALDEGDYGFLAAEDFDGWRQSLTDRGLPNLQRMGWDSVYDGSLDPLDATRVLGPPPADAAPVRLHRVGGGRR